MSVLISWSTVILSEWIIMRSGAHATVREVSKLVNVKCVVARFKTRHFVCDGCGFSAYLDE